MSHHNRAITVTPHQGTKPRAGGGLARITASAAAADELRRRIIDGELKSGSQLRQDALAEELGVSRIPIREALVQLEAEGLVKSIPHKGSVVAEISKSEIEEIFDLRALIEPDLLQHSASHLTEIDYHELQTILDAYTVEIRSNHVSRWGEMNQQFHMLLYSRADRPRSLVIVSNLLAVSDRLTRLQLSLTYGMERAEREHVELVTLCAQGKIKSACKLLRHHIEHAGASLLASLTPADKPAPIQRPGRLHRG